MKPNQLKTLIAYLENKCAFDQPMGHWHAGMMIDLQPVGPEADKTNRIIYYFWKLRNRE